MFWWTSPWDPRPRSGSYRQAYQLRKLFEFVGEHMGMTLDVIITDGSQPVGRGIGPVLEVRDVMQVLKNDPDAPKDFAEKCLDLAGRVIDFDPARAGRIRAVPRRRDPQIGQGAWTRWSASSRPRVPILPRRSASACSMPRPPRRGRSDLHGQPEDRQMRQARGSPDRRGSRRRPSEEGWRSPCGGRARSSGSTPSRKRISATPGITG